MRVDLLGGDPARVGQQLRDGVIAGEAQQPALSHQVSARVADVRDEQIGPALQAAVSVVAMPAS
jgi:hypothetical protein